ncbi:hypothetical protein GLOIN_2v1666047 [Rhizophagus irregularis DAOM 181602=DAOM 197198]|nr:hypothetical protein GLOIN_2v1666047 [Rhizophagus irregularis DAOM 181602=DAOM 197198]
MNVLVAKFLISATTRNSIMLLNVNYQLLCHIFYSKVNVDWRTIGTRIYTVYDGRERAQRFQMCLNISNIASSVLSHSLNA